MKLQIAILPIIALLTPGVFAQNSFSLDTLMRSLATKERSSAKFVEYRHNNITTKPTRISGRLFYTKPDILIKENLHPVAEKLTIIADRVELERTENGKKISRTLAIENFPFIESMVIGLRATFAGDLKKLKSRYKISLSGDNSNWQLVLNANDVSTDPDSLFENSISKMVINGSQTDFHKVEMLDSNGDKTVINITPL